ncbi:hypothetical protein ACQ7HM_03875 [Williamsia sp. MIQD14]|uniref:hypothetical protein n=1 Tax=Williamsia sp. MIQD14 TaxID=3425703 RepID=UPI003DA07055
MGMIVRRRFGKWSASVSLLAVTMVCASACSSGGGSAEPAPSSSANIQSASVAPGVEKDSVLDLNSTKDMTGVVTTVPIGKSPYDKNMPDICSFITPEAMGRLGVDSKEKGFNSFPLVTQTCTLTAALDNDFLISAVIYVNNIEEHLSVPSFKGESREATPLFGNVKAYKLTDQVATRPGGPYTCEVAWGTFYGTAAVRFNDDKSDASLCDRAFTAAKTIGPLMPKSPSQMRPSS